MREDKAELRARVFLLEKERATIELKLNARDTQIAAQHATIQHLQGQLSDAEAMLAMATNKVLPVHLELHQLEFVFLFTWLTARASRIEV